MRKRLNGLAEDATTILSKRYDIINAIKSICRDVEVEDLDIDLTVECNCGTELMNVTVHKIELEDDYLKLYAIGEFCDLVYVYSSDLTIDNWVSLAYGLEKSDVFENVTEQ